MIEQWWTPPKLAKRLGICPDRVIGLILAGEIHGVDLSSKGSTRPRYRVSEDAVQDFLRRRSVTPAPKVKRSRRTTAKREFYA